MDALFSFLVRISHNFGVGVQEDLGGVEEIDLKNLIAQSEHDSVFGLQPLLHIDQLPLAYWNDSPVFDLSVEIIFKVF